MDGMLGQIVYRRREKVHTEHSLSQDVSCRVDTAGFCCFLVLPLRSVPKVLRVVFTPEDLLQDPSVMMVNSNRMNLISSTRDPSVSPVKSEPLQC